MPLPEDRVHIADDVWLRPVDHRDADDIVHGVRDRAVIRWTRIPAPYARADAETFLSMVVAASGSPPTTFAVALADPDLPDGRLVGVVGLEVDTRAGTAEIGYWIGSAARRRGLVAAAAREVCRYGFDHLGLERIALLAAVDNEGSNVIAQRLGFTLEGRLRAAHRYRDGDGTTVGRGDMHAWGLLPGELVG